MIWLYNSGNLAGSYKGFESVSDYFMRLEHFRATENSVSHEERWAFSCYRWEHLRGIFEGFEGYAPWTALEREAYGNGFDLIELCCGNPQGLQQVVLFPEVDVEGLARDWCFGYAWAKNFTLLELIDGEGAGTAQTFGRKFFPHGAQPVWETEGEA